MSVVCSFTWEYTALFCFVLSIQVLTVGLCSPNIPMLKFILSEPQNARPFLLSFSLFPSFLVSLISSLYPSLLTPILSPYYPHLLLVQNNY